MASVAWPAAARLRRGRKTVAGPKSNPRRNDHQVPGALPWIPIQRAPGRAVHPGQPVFLRLPVSPHPPLQLARGCLSHLAAPCVAGTAESTLTVSRAPSTRDRWPRLTTKCTTNRTARLGEHTAHITAAWLDPGARHCADDHLRPIPGPFPLATPPVAS